MPGIILALAILPCSSLSIMLTFQCAIEVIRNIDDSGSGSRFDPCRSVHLSHVTLISSCLCLVYKRRRPRTHRFEKGSESRNFSSLIYETAPLPAGYTTSTYRLSKSIIIISRTQEAQTKKKGDLPDMLSVTL